MKPQPSWERCVLDYLFCFALSKGKEKGKGGLKAMNVSLSVCVFSNIKKWLY